MVGYMYQLAAHLWVIADCLKSDSTSIWIDFESSQSKCPILNLLFVANLESVKDTNPITLKLSQSLVVRSYYRGPY